MKIFQTAVTIFCTALTSLAMAGEIKPYSAQEFETLTSGGKPVVIDVSATWCPTCKAQKPLIEGLMKQPAYRDVTVLTVDFDTNKPALKKFRVSTQSTLVAFKGAAEIGRSVGDTSATGIENLISRTVK